MWSLASLVSGVVSSLASLASGLPLSSAGSAPLACSAGAAPLACPRTSLIAAISSFLRMPDVPLTPTWLASARSSGSTMVVRAPTGACVFASGVSVVTAVES
ncbi:hypothetical protein RE97_06710 [Mycobacterium avium subsp. paratuberculosis]|nr:hypothetical protein RE97_06710 [Mycobacterium avium subsp. paratuberculosis]